MSHHLPLLLICRASRTLADTDFPSPEGRRLSWPGWLGEILSWFARPKTVIRCSTVAAVAGNRTLNVSGAIDFDVSIVSATLLSCYFGATLPNFYRGEITVSTWQVRLNLFSQAGLTALF